MFKSLHTKSRKRKLREFFWPSMGIARLALYYKYRLCRTKETSQAIATGFACGVAISFTPFLGLHLLLGALTAWMLRGSLTAMVVGSLAGNPWTFPFIWVMTYKLGRYFLGKTSFLTDHQVVQFTFNDLLHQPIELLLPMILGSIPFMVLSFIIAFYFAQRVVNSYKEKNRQIRIQRGDNV